MKGFFISYNRADRAWAEWIAPELQAVGFSVARRSAPQTLHPALDLRHGFSFLPAN